MVKTLKLGTRMRVIPIGQDITWDDGRFADNVYAVVRGITVARIVTLHTQTQGDLYGVFACPDAPREYQHDERGVGCVEAFRDFENARQHIVSYVRDNPL